MQFRTLVSLLLALALAMLMASCGVAQQTPTTRPSLVGCWAGEDFQPVLGHSAQWLMNRRDDGTFTIAFRSKDGTTQREEGTWRQEGNAYTTITTKIDGEPVDPNDPQFTDVYEIRSVTNDVMEYYHARMKLIFKSRRVACDSDA